MISGRKLAELAGVSQATVSRCLNDHPAISPETKERVCALAKEHGYILEKKHGRATCTRTRRAIAILMMRNPFFEDLFVNQIVHELFSLISNENYYPMTLINVYGSSGMEQLHDLLQLGLVEGFIIINRKFDTVIADYLKNNSVPHIYLTYHQRNNVEQTNVVDTDNFASGYMATRHLLDLGHRDIVAITTPLDEYNDRMQGYQAALRDAGIPYNTNYVIHTAPDYPSCYREVSYRLDKLPSVTAIYAQFDMGGLAALNAIRDHGLSVPEDISVISSDGFEIGALFRPALTAMRQPITKLAEHAVQRLLQIVDAPGNVPESKLYLQPELILRDTTAAPKK